MNWVWHFLGFDYGLPYGHVGAYNVWSGFLGDVSIIGALITGVRVAMRNHRERIAQAASHQKALLEQAAEHHKAHMELLRRQHSQVLDAEPQAVTVNMTSQGLDAEKVAEEVKRQFQLHRRRNGGGM